MTSPPLPLRAALAALLVSALSGCGPLPFLNPEGSSTSSSTGGNTRLDVQPTLTSLQEKVFSPSCSFASCHGGNTPQSGLDHRTKESTFAGLVNKVARRGYCSDAGPPASPVLLVVPGQPEQSLLMRKLTATQAELVMACQGGPMPKTSQMLPQEALDAIEQWIADGALNN